MTSRFAQNVIKELNKFRNNPKSIQHDIELIRKGFSRIRSGDPFLNEIETFIRTLDTMKQLPSLEYNEVLSNAAKKNYLILEGRQIIKSIEEPKILKGLFQITIW